MDILDGIGSPCALKHEVEEVKRYLRTFKLLACNLSKYLDWHGTGKIKRADLHVMFEKEGFLLQPERLDALMSSLNSMDGNSVTVADLAAGIQAWSTKLKDREEQRANSDNQRVVGSRSNLQTYGIINDQREDQDEEGLQDMEVLVIMRRVLGSKIQDTFPCPSTLSGPMGREVDHYRRLCFREYLKSLEQCQQNIHNVSQATLQKVLLHPSDKSISSCSKMGGKDLFPGRGRHERGLASLCTPKMYRVENEKGAPRKCHKKEYRKKQSSSWADPNAFWPGREDHVRLFLPVMKQSPAMVLFQCIERTAAPSPGNWPINHLGYSTSGDIGAHKVYTL